MIQWLLSQGIQVNVHDDSKSTPLHAAVAAGSIQAVNILLAHGADVSAKDQFDSQPIHECYMVDTVILQRLIEAGADVNSICGCGTWPLSIACEQGDADAVRCLLNFGADVHLNSTGETALFKAIYQDHIDCAEILLDAGADVNAQDVDDWTCLFSIRSSAMLELLLSHGADPSIPDECGELPEDWSGNSLSIRHRLKEVRLMSDDNSAMIE